METISAEDNINDLLKELDEDLKKLYEEELFDEDPSVWNFKKTYESKSNERRKVKKSP